MDTIDIIKSLNIGDNIIVNNDECIVVRYEVIRMPILSLTLIDINTHKNFTIVFDIFNTQKLDIKLPTNEYILK